MTIFDLACSTLWTITHDQLRVILEIASRENDLEAVAAKAGKPLENTHTVTYRTDYGGKTAIVPITGPIFRRANLFTQISGATSTEVIASDLRAAWEDPSVTAICLDIDSPGGDARGVADLATMIREMSARKPIVGFADGACASGAYWLGAACSHLAASSTSLLGSVGVVAVVPDPSKNKSSELEFVSSKSPNKRPDYSTEKGKAQIQRRVDDTAEVFINDIAKYRNTTPDKVTSDFGEGGVKMGQSAVEAGMADRVTTFESLLQDLGQRKPLPSWVAPKKPMKGKGLAMAKDKEATQEMTMEELQAQLASLASSNAELLSKLKAKDDMAFTESLNTIAKNSEAFFASMNGKSVTPAIKPQVIHLHAQAALIDAGITNAVAHINDKGGVAICHVVEGTMAPKINLLDSVKAAFSGLPKIKVLDPEQIQGGFTVLSNEEDADDMKKQADAAYKATVAAETRNKVKSA